MAAQLGFYLKSQIIKTRRKLKIVYVRDVEYDLVKHFPGSVCILYFFRPKEVKIKKYASYLKMTYLLRAYTTYL